MVYVDAGAEVIGIHAHSGSGILDPNNWRTVAGELVQISEIDTAQPSMTPFHCSIASGRIRL